MKQNKWAEFQKKNQSREYLENMRTTWEIILSPYMCHSQGSLVRGLHCESNKIKLLN